MTVFLGIVLCVLLLSLTRPPLFVVVGSLCVLTLFFGFDGSTQPESLSMIPAKTEEIMDKNVLLAIPFFVMSGTIMSRGSIAKRLVDVARALTGFLPGGLAAATVGACMFFAAISGSSPVTVIAIGSMAFPQLCRAGYDEQRSIGLLTSAGSLGILIPPSIPMLVYAMVAGFSVTIDVGQLFLAGLGPGLLLGVLLAGHAMFHARHLPRDGFSWTKLRLALREGSWSIALPVVILGGIYSGFFTATEAAAVSVLYAIFVEVFVHADLRLRELPRTIVDSAQVMGTIVVIMALASGLNAYFVEEQIPQNMVEHMKALDLGSVEFFLLMNLLLLAAGALMDSISAILILAPLLAPLAASLDIDPIHLGIVMIVNLEIGYLTPPIGINLFVATSTFKRPIGEVIKGTFPFALWMLVGLALVTYVPSISLGLGQWLQDDSAYVERSPTSADDSSSDAIHDSREDRVNELPDAASESEASSPRVKSIEELMREAKAAPSDAANAAPRDAEQIPKDAAPTRVKSVQELMQELSPPAR